MPAFMFEKISPPTDRGSVQPNAKDQSKKRSGLIVQILDRFVEVRSKKSLRRGRGVIAHNKSKTSD